MNKTKTLKSGMTVDSDEYYQLLDWKDKNMSLFFRFLFIKDRLKNPSINEMDSNTYQQLLIFAGLKK